MRENVNDAFTNQNALTNQKLVTTNLCSSFSASLPPIFKQYLVLLSSISF